VLALEILVRENIDCLKLITRIEKKKLEIKAQNVFIRLLQLLKIKKRKYKIRKIYNCKKTDNIIIKALSQVCNSFEGDLLYSTRVSMQFLRVYKLLTEKEQPEYIIDNKENIDKQDRLEIENVSGKVIKGIGVVEIMREEQMNTIKESKCRLIIKPNITDIRLNRCFDISFTINGQVPFTPILKIYLPGHIDILNKEKIFIREQYAELPVFSRKFSLTFNAIRTGLGKIKAELHGMYDLENKCWSSSPEIIVNGSL